ncbi:MAG: glycosyltransferase 9 family protein [Coxiella sp. (in: Bacteria)]|nr:MAG: glycosyltransferase 9 family protein [Coxiella sp. (in: g-proteobacteria)]
MKILFITHTRLGDATLSSCILNHLHQAYPDARFTIAVGPVAAQLFEDTPNLDQLIIVKKEKYNAHWFKLWSKCLFQRWDIVIDCRGSAIGWALWAKQRFCRYAPNTKHIHRVERYAGLLKLDTPSLPKVFVGPSHRAKTAILLPKGKTVIAIGPAANWTAKTWRAEYFIDLITQLRDVNGPFPDAYIALIAAPQEREQVQSVIDAIPNDRFIDLIGTQHLLTVAACLQHCKLFIGNDSGLMHMAAAVGTPTIGLFGPTHQEKYGPYGPHCCVVSTPETPEQLMDFPEYNHLTCGTLMDSIGVDDVMKRVNTHLTLKHPERID